MTRASDIKPWLITILSVGVTAVLTSVPVSAQVTQINACAKTTNGDVTKITIETASCSNKQTAVSWNIPGVIGPAGPAGPTGASGPAGATGAAGATGPIGATGPAGATGSAGATGAAGATGPTGASGPTGQTGLAGPLGPAGASGPQGPAGPQGLAGPQGPAGAAGGWSVTGNAGATAGADFIGTTDRQSIEFHANAARVMRYDPAVANTLNDISPNVVGGDARSLAQPGTQGATIGGGGGVFNGNLGLGNLTGPNMVEADFGTVTGGLDNLASGAISSVGGGGVNTATAEGAAVGGGFTNAVNGRFATTPGGENNLANGMTSFAAGTAANTQSDGDFIWSDASSTFTFDSLAANEFAARAIGGVRFVTAIDLSGNPLAGVTLVPGSGTWSQLSDRNAKANFKPVDGEEVVRQLAAIPVSIWNYKTQAASIRHIGPMAQDFRAAFQVGEDDRHITTIDSEGVALAAIQGLYKMIQAQDAKVAAVQRHDTESDTVVETLRQEARAENARLDGLEQHAAVTERAWTARTAGPAAFSGSTRPVSE